MLKWLLFLLVCVWFTQSPSMLVEAGKYGKKRKRDITKQQEQVLHCDVCVRAVDQFIKGIEETENNYKVLKRHRIDEKTYISRDRSDERLQEILGDVKQWFTRFSLKPNEYSRLQETGAALRQLSRVDDASDIAQDVTSFDRITRRIVDQVTDKVIERHELEWVAVFHKGQDGDDYHREICVDLLNVCVDGEIEEMKQTIVNNDLEDKELVAPPAVPEDQERAAEEGDAQEQGGEEGVVLMGEAEVSPQQDDAESDTVKEEEGGGGWW